MIDPLEWLVIINGGSHDFNLENPSIVLLFCNDFISLNCNDNDRILIFPMQTLMSTSYLHYGWKNYWLR